MHFSCDSCPCIIYLETKPYTVRVFVVSSMAVNLLHTVTCLAIKIDQELTSANHMRSLACWFRLSDRRMRFLLKASFPNAILLFTSWQLLPSSNQPTSEVTNFLHCFQVLSINFNSYRYSFCLWHSRDFGLLRINFHVVLLWCILQHIHNQLQSFYSMWYHGLVISKSKAGILTPPTLTASCSSSSASFITYWI